MRLLYNLIQLLLAPVIFILLPVYLLVRPEKCKTIFPKLGFDLEPVSSQEVPVVWIHALSVGEVTSALPLVRHLKQSPEHPPIIVFSASTVSGMATARRILSEYCDHLIYGPVDMLPVVHRFITRIDPDLFILIETDFWPNVLHALDSSGVPSLLVNGRVSDASMSTYRRFSFFFQPLFNSFEMLCMQSQADALKMKQLGIDEKKIKTIGNLKFGNQHYPVPEANSTSPFPPDKRIILAGSTHDGEEQIILELCTALRMDFSEIHIVIAPRKIDRAERIEALAEQHGLLCSRFSRTGTDQTPADVTIIDTIGDLSGLYVYSDICFIGGSLVPEGGHNPIEAARAGKPVLFGPYMDDFSDISQELVDADAALQVIDSTGLAQSLQFLLESPERCASYGRKAKDFVHRHQHVLDAHLTVISSFL